MDFYIAPLDNPLNAKLILENKGGGWAIADWNQDETKMIVKNFTSINDSKLYMLNLLSGKLEEINPVNEQISYTSTKFSNDNRGVFLISDEDTEFWTLRYFDLGTKKMSKLMDIDYDVDIMELSADGSKLAFVLNKAGYSKPYLLDSKTKRATF